MKKKLILIEFMLVYLIQAYSQSHFIKNSPESNGSVMKFLTLVRSIDNSNLSIGDEIAIFDSQYCVGVTTITVHNIYDSIIPVIAFKDELSTPGIIEGFRTGNTASIKLWDASAGIEIIEIEIEGLYGRSMNFASEDSIYLNIFSTSPTPLNTAPLVSDIPGQIISEGSSFISVNLDSYVTDTQTPDSNINWNFSGNSQLNISIINRIATISVPDFDWNGNETIIFTATDNDETNQLSNSDDVTFTVGSVNDAPVISGIPYQSIRNGDNFAAIQLDNFVSDDETPVQNVSWNYKGDEHLSINIIERVANISIPDSTWYGSDTITFIAIDNNPVQPLKDSIIVIFTIIDNRIKIMPMGNSITYDYFGGADADDGNRISYRYYLYNLLNLINCNFDFVGSENGGANFFSDTENAGFPGVTTNDLAELLQTGFNPHNGQQVISGPYLDSFLPDIILLHIGTNDLQESPSGVENILNEIDAYKLRTGKDTKIILAKIINRKTHNQITTNFNANVRNMAINRNDPDIYFVDMENGAGFNYVTDMNDNVHPNYEGYMKMAICWFKKLLDIIPQNYFSPIILNTPITNGVVNVNYNSRIEAVGIPRPVYSLITAPVGMTINDVTGIISWIPPSTGDYLVTISASNQYGADTISMTLHITGPIIGLCVDESYILSSGQINDNSGSSNYFNNMNCSKLIQPTGMKNIILTFSEFNTEAGYDFVKIYNGSSTSDPLLGQFSGSFLPSSVKATNGSMLINFITDRSVTGSGWAASYTSNYENSSPCNNETLTATSATITDNSGSSNYANNMSCQKLIQLDGMKNIVLTFNQFNTETGYDFVRVYNGSTTSSPLIGEFSGSSIPASVTATNGSMLVTFVSDYSVVASGWNASYTSNNESSEICTNETFADATGTITDNSGSANYEINMSCQKLIQPDGMKNIVLTFSQFSTESGYDFVKVYNGSTTASPLLGKFSGNSIPASVTATGGSMLITFISDYSVVASGWTATYTSNNESSEICTNETFADASGTVTDNSGTFDYMNNMNCQKLIQPEGMSNIILTFTQFSTESGYDWVRVYNGSTTSAPLIGEFTANVLPASVRATGGSMLITFTTDYSVVSSGWSATYTSNNDYFGPCIDEMYTAISGIITDNSGSVSYYNNMNCDKLIQPSGATSISLAFSQFSTETGYDFVRVYDGATTSATLLGQYSGSGLPPVLISTGASMLISFISDYSEVAQGWNAQYIATTGIQAMKGADALPNSLSEPLKIVVYPNPVKDLLTIESNITDEQVFNIELVNTSGQIVLYQRANVFMGRYELDVSAINDGLYILKVTSDDKIEFVRVIKQ